MIVVRITEEELSAHDACEPGIDLWREIATMQDEACAREVPCVEIEWTPLAAVWLAVSHPAFTGWLRDVGLVPTSILRYAVLRYAVLRDAVLSGADLRDADLEGAWRNDSDPPLAGWVVVESRLQSALETCVCGHSKVDHGDVGAICNHCDCTTFRPRTAA